MHCNLLCISEPFSSAHAQGAVSRIWILGERDDAYLLSSTETVTSGSNIPAFQFLPCFSLFFPSFLRVPTALTGIFFSVCFCFLNICFLQKCPAWTFNFQFWISASSALSWQYPHHKTSRYCQKSQLLLALDPGSGMTIVEVSPISPEKSRMTEMWQCSFGPLVCSSFIAMQQHCLEYMMYGFSRER